MEYNEKEISVFLTQLVVNVWQEEEEGSDEDSVRYTPPPVCFPDKTCCGGEEGDSDTAFVSPLDEIKTVRHSTVTMSNLHEASRYTKKYLFKYSKLFHTEDSVWLLNEREGSVEIQNNSIYKHKNIQILLKSYDCFTRNAQQYYLLKSNPSRQLLWHFVL